MDSCQQRVSTDQCPVTASQAQEYMEATYFLKLSADQFLVFNWLRAQVYFLKWNSLYFLFTAKVELLEKDIS